MERNRIERGTDHFGDRQASSCYIPYVHVYITPVEVTRYSYVHVYCTVCTYILYLTGIMKKKEAIRTYTKVLYLKVDILPDISRASGRS